MSYFLIWFEPISYYLNSYFLKFLLIMIMLQLNEVIEKYHLTADNIYNIDEKGFVIGLGSKVRRIMSREAYEQGRVRQTIQDGNHEFITLIACVSALGATVPPTLLYKGESGDLQDTWVDQLEEQDDVFFGSTKNGWTNDLYGLQWLQKVFEPRTRPARKTTKRLLIVDEHSSHVNLRYIEWAHNHGILILILSSHSTHDFSLSTSTVFNL